MYRRIDEPVSRCIGARTAIGVLVCHGAASGVLMYGRTRCIGLSVHGHENRLADNEDSNSECYNDLEYLKGPTVANKFPAVDEDLEGIDHASTSCLNIWVSELIRCF